MIITMDNKTAIRNNELVERSRSGDAKAQKELYEAYSGAMYSIAVRMVNDLPEAQDILQESFIAAFQNLNRFESRSSFGAWLKRIVINKSIDSVKKKKHNIVELNEDIVEDVDEEGISYDISSVNEAVKNYRTVIVSY